MPSTPSHDRPARAGRRLDGVEQRLAAHQAEADQLHANPELARPAIGDKEIQRFLSNPHSLPEDKIPALVDYAGHVGEVASRLLIRGDCPPEIVSDFCRLHGNDPGLARLIFKYGGQLDEADNQQLYDAHQADWMTVLAQVSHQQLTPGLNWRVYLDQGDNPYIRQMMIDCQNSLPDDLVGQLWQDYGGQPEFAVALAAGPRLPEAVVRQSWDRYRHDQRFVAALFQYQPDLPADIVRAGFDDYDRSFRLVFGQAGAAQPEEAPTGLILVQGLTLEAVDGDPDRLLRLLEGLDQAGVGSLPAEVIQQAKQAADSFVAFAANLICNNQLDQPLARRVWDELGRVPVIAVSLVMFQQSLPGEVVAEAFVVYGSDLPFVKLLLTNVKDLPREILDQAYQTFRLHPDFDGDWFDGQENLTPTRREELRRWQSASKLGVALLD